MNRLTAYCGINCGTCPLYLATVNGDEKLKAEVAEKWGKIYKRTLKIDEMKCKGCKSDLKFGACRKCDISTCNKNKGTNTCSECEVYPCDRIKSFIDWQGKNNTEVEIIK